MPRNRAPYAVLAAALLLTLAATAALRLNAQARDRARFAGIVQSTSDRIERRLDAYLALLSATNGVFSSQREVTPAEFRKYVELLDLHRNHPGVQGIGFTQRIDPEERSELERRLRAATGFADFHVWPEASPDDELHAIVMLEPLDERNRAAIGYNMHSEPIRRQAMDRARDTGRPALSGLVTLKQEIDEKKQPGFLLYFPVYRGGDVPATLAQRRDRLLGFVYSPFRAVDLLTGIFGTEQLPNAAFELYDGDARRSGSLLYASHPHEQPPEAPTLTTTTTLEIAGRPWTLAFATLPAFDDVASSRLVFPFMLVGVALSLALFAVTRAQVRAREQAETIADELRVAVDERARIEAQLRDADRRKDEFLAMLAHELRNPLAPVLTAVQLMGRKQGADSALAHEREVIQRQVHHMRRLVDDLLDVSRVTRGKIQLQRLPLELAAAARHALEAARPFVEERRHSLEAELPQEPLWAEVDPVRFEQVVSNLLHNAAKYTEPGGRITLSLARADGEAVLRVADTGIGVSPDFLPHLFEPFMQVGRSLDRAQGGLGLGLTLVKRLVEMHGGRVEASSDGPGRGSVFSVRLPLLDGARVPAAADVPQAAETVVDRPVRVLVVDDNLDAAELLGEVLDLDGHEVALAHDGTEALERLATFAPDVVFLDIGLPGLDGFEVARRIRQRPDGGAVRLVAVTGYGQVSDKRRSHEAGFDAHLVKPVELEAVRAQAASVRRAGFPPPRPPSSSESEPAAAP